MNEQGNDNENRIRLKKISILDVKRFGVFFFSKGKLVFFVARFATIPFSWNGRRS